MSNPVDIVLTADASSVAKAVKDVTAASNNAASVEKEKQRQAQLSLTLHKRLADLSEQQHRDSRARLTLEQQIAIAKEKQLRIEERLQRAATTQQRVALGVARGRANATLQELAARQRDLAHADESGRQSALQSVIDGTIVGGMMGRFGSITSLVGNIVRSGLSRGAAIGGASLAGAGVVGYGASAAYGHTAELAARARETSKRTGLGYQDSQALDFASGILGNRDQVFNVLDDLKQNVGQALQGSEQAQKAFQNLGVSINDLRSKGSLAILQQIASSLKAGGDNAMQFADASSVMGRGFKDLAPDLQKLIDKMGEFRSSAAGLSDATIGNMTANKQWWGKIWEGAKNKANRGLSVIGTGAMGWANRLALAFGGGFMSQDQRDQLIANIGANAEGIDVTGAAAQQMQVELVKKRAMRDERRRQEAKAKDNAYIDRMDTWMSDSLRQDMEDRKFLSGPRGSLIGRGDALARIGLFRGGSSIDPTRIQRDQLTELRKLVVEMKGLRGDLSFDPGE